MGPQKRKAETDPESDEELRNPLKMADVELKSVFVNDLEVNQEEEEYFEEEHFDDKTGEKLNPGLVAEAENEEIEFMKRIGVGEECEERECWEMTGKPPTTTKFVRVNKGSDEKPDVRARLCARDFKKKGDKNRSDLFAAMPPLEAKKLLFRQAAREKAVWRAGKWQRKKLLFIDVKKAHLNGIVGEDIFVYVKLPDGKCWRLKRWLYGMRPAASAWEMDFSENMKNAGCEKGKSAPTVFFNKDTDSRCVVHGDDFTFLAYEAEIPNIIEKMQAWYDIKVRGVLGGQPGDDEEVTILNRRLTWRRGVIEYEADPKHVQAIIEDMGLTRESKGLEAPVEKEEVNEEASEDDNELLEGEEAKKFRGIAARGNYLSLDRADIQYATKEICRSMARPRKSSWKKLKTFSSIPCHVSEGRLEVLQ